MNARCSVCGLLVPVHGHFLAAHRAEAEDETDCAGSYGDDWEPDDGRREVEK